MRSVLLFAFAALPLFAEHRSAAAGDDILHALKPVTDAMLAKPGPEDWLMRRGDYRAWGYSALDQINDRNVSKLHLQWTYSLPYFGLEMTPLPGQLPAMPPWAPIGAWLRWAIEYFSSPITLI